MKWLSNTRLFLRHVVQIITQFDKYIFIGMYETSINLFEQKIVN